MHCLSITAQCQSASKIAKIHEVCLETLPDQKDGQPDANNGPLCDNGGNPNHFFIFLKSLKHTFMYFIL